MQGIRLTNINFEYKRTYQLYIVCLSEQTAVIKLLYLRNAAAYGRQAHASPGGVVFDRSTVGPFVSESKLVLFCSS